MRELRNRPVGYQLPKSNRYVIRIVLATVLMTFAILAILPFTQVLSGDPRDRTLRSIDTAQVPPPEPPPPEPPPPPEEEKELDAPEPEQAPPMFDISMLESMLNPTAGGALSAVIDFSSFMGADSLNEAIVFSLRDLDRVPRLLTGGTLNFPPEVQRSGVKGRVRVRVRIDERGRVDVRDIQDSPHPGISEVLRRELVRWIYEAPTVNGEPVTAEYWQPFEIDFSR